EAHDLRTLPLPRLSAPSLRAVAYRPSVDLAAVRQDGGVAAGMTIGGSYEADAAVEVLVVVPGDESGDPRTDPGERRKRLGREARPVLHRPEERLRIGVVVAHAGPAEGRHHAEPLQRRQHGRALHRPAIVRMENEACRLDAVL